MNPLEIKRIVGAIREASLAGTPDYRLRKTYADFHKQLPHLFDAALNPMFEMKYLDMMLSHIKTVADESTLEVANDKEVLFEKADEAIIGALREEYLDPLIASAPRTDTPQEPVIEVKNDGGSKVSLVTEIP